ncbi:hypothetical protein [Streptomyces eurocidicus]|uniref:Uncharacterized protein n=1 Tax=Streptomyces eurocidicus TaxID=66423 RepID=A0A7W8BF69_STREU|nr:hypothetical protein [Streptomyces eurocidicus]MBB5121782.1 hypothetical protein [Streptomyces eurocidicus]MBF6055049.1 hypothetical protein [Streptomyces eurocidicus]
MNHRISADPHTGTTPDDSAGLPAAVARLTDTLAGQAGDPGTGCHQCYGEEEVAELRDPRAPLSDDLVHYTARDLTHWPRSAEAARRVLPRLAALAAAGEYVGELEGTALHQAGWQTWPQDQADAVCTFLDAYWTTALRRRDPDHPLDDVFAFCSTAHGTPAPCLARWERERHPAADAHLADTAHGWIEDLLLDAVDPVDPLWSTSPGSAPDPEAQLRTWILTHAAPRLRRHTTDPALRHTLDRLQALGLPMGRDSV